MAWPTSVTNSVFWLAIIATPIDHAHYAYMYAALTLCFVLMHTIGLVCAGKGHQQHIMSKLCNDAMQVHVGYVVVNCYYCHMKPGQSGRNI